MRKQALVFASVILITAGLGTSAAWAVPASQTDIRTARAEAANLPPAAVQAPSRPAAGFDELRDCAALVLVGGMLIGLAAAVRRTA